MPAGEAKGMAKDSILSVSTLKGNEEMTKALSPSMDTLMASMKGLDAQKAVLTALRFPSYFLLQLNAAE